MTLRIYSTLSRRKEVFEPIGDPVRFYCCGMTPKFYPHLGHAKLFVTMDVIRRYLHERGYQVRYVQNFTDVDDKIIARSQSEGSSPEEVVKRYTEGYFQSMAALNVELADAYPRVTETIDAIIEMIVGLIENGHAYAPGNGDVYFRVASFPGYGKLSRRTAEDVLAGARVHIGEEKEDPRDFALWKASKPGEPAWSSPWGAGRPGWHIECSAMSRQQLGDQIDIHAGGPDLIFPHHENEIAQSESFTRRDPFAKYWVHIGQLNVGNEKMAHSLNNFTTVLDVLKVHHPMVLRLYYLSQHYRTPVNFTPESLEQAQKPAERLLETKLLLQQMSSTSSTTSRDTLTRQAVSELELQAQELKEYFYAAMDDDFNTALALSHLYTFGRELARLHMAIYKLDNQLRSQIMTISQQFNHLLNILGLALPDDPAELQRNRGISVSIDIAAIERLVSERDLLRRQKRWPEADAIRRQLAEQGVILEDSPAGTTWRRG